MCFNMEEVEVGRGNRQEWNKEVKLNVNELNFLI